MLRLRLIDFKQRDIQDLHLAPSYAGQTAWLIGQNANCDLVLPTPDVDCLHGRIFHSKGLYYFVDLGSKAGSLINGEPVSAGSIRQLAEGDLLQIGKTSLYFKSFSSPSTVSQAAVSSLSSQNHSHRSQNLLQIDSQQRQSSGEIFCRCLEIIEETPDVKTFRFVPEPFVSFDYQPGQFVNVQVEIDGNPVTRPYTLSSSPSRPDSLAITVKRCPAPQDAPDAPIGLVSNWLHDHLQPGDRIKLVGGAMGHFTCADRVPPKLLFISAGSGITPMMSMSRWLQDTQANCDILFLHSARNPEDIIFRTELEVMAAQMPNFQLAITVTQPAPKTAWAGLTGRISASLLRLVAPDLMDRSVYVCGSNAFMQSTRAMLEAVNFPMQNYQAESFGGRTTASLLPHSLS